MDQLTHNVRRANWLNIINQCQNRPSDVSQGNGLLTMALKKKLIIIGCVSFVRKPMDKCRFPRLPSPLKSLLRSIPFVSVKSSAYC